MFLIPLILLVLLATMATTSEENIPVAREVACESETITMARYAKEAALTLAQYEREVRMEQIKSEERITLKRAQEEAFQFKVDSFVKDGESHERAMIKAMQFDEREARIVQRTHELDAQFYGTVAISFAVGAFVGYGSSKL